MEENEQPPFESIVRTEQTIEAPQRHVVQPLQFVAQLKKGVETPSVLNVNKWRAVNDAPQNITNFRHGQNGQTIQVLGDGFSTVVHGSGINTNDGANRLLEEEKVYTFTKYSDGWYEAEGQLGGTGGDGGVPSGGAAGALLGKASSTDYDTTWFTLLDDDVLTIDGGLL